MDRFYNMNKEGVTIILINRQCRIIIKIIDENNFILISTIAGMLHVGTRTVRYDLDVIDEFLKSKGLPTLIRKPKLGIKFPDVFSSEDETLKFIESLTADQYLLLPEERIYHIINHLLQRQDYITINAIALELMVSRNTVLKDLVKIKEWLKKFNLSVDSVTKHGIRITGKEWNIRKAQKELIINLPVIGESTQPESVNLSYRNEKVRLNHQIGKIFSDIHIPYIEQCVKKAEEDLETIFSDESYFDLVLYIAITIRRIRLHQEITISEDEFKFLQITKEYSTTVNLAEKLAEYFKIKISVDEIAYLTIHLLGSNGVSMAADEKENWPQLQILTYTIIQNVSRLLNKRVYDDQLFKGLMEHLRPTLYRLKHDIPLNNPILNEIKTTYDDLFAVIKEGLKSIENYTGKPLGDEEVGYFTMHFSAALERMNDVITTRADILLVCVTGNGTAELLSSKIEAIFDVNIVGKVPYHQVKAVIKQRHIDLIISTIPLEPMDIPYIKVSPLLKDADIENLKRYLTKLKKTDSMLEYLVGIIERHCNVVEYDKLLDDLKTFMNITKCREIEENHSPMLTDLITEETIELNVEATTWEEAVKAGGELLVKNGMTAPEYIYAMIHTVKQLGPYIVIAPGIALPHARPEDGVKKIGMSLISLKKAVPFGNADYDPVKIVICLCAIDNSSHLKALSSLMNLLEDQDFISIVNHTNDKKRILDYIDSMV